MIKSSDKEFITLVKMTNFTFGKFTVSQSEFAKYFVWFLSIKSDFAKFYYFLILVNVLFGVGMYSNND